MDNGLTRLTDGLTIETDKNMTYLTSVCQNIKELNALNAHEKGTGTGIGTETETWDLGRATGRQILELHSSTEFRRNFDF